MFTSNSDLIKIVKKAILIILIVSVPVGYTEYRIRHTIDDDFMTDQFRYDEIFNNTKKADILILGSSRGLFGIIPKLLTIDGHSVYNFCFLGASPSYNYDLYKNVISTYYTKPKLVIYDVHGLLFDNGTLSRKLIHDYKHIPTSKVFEITSKNSAFPMMPYDHLRITHEDDVFRALKSSFRTKPGSYLAENYDRGFIPSTGEFKASSKSTEVYNNSYEMMMFGNLIQLLQSQHVAILFVETPECANEVKYHNVANKNNALITAFANKYSISYLNYNDNLRSFMSLDRRYFTDPTHLSYLGARTFSRILISDLSKLILSKNLL